MNQIRVRNKTRGTTLGDRIDIADTFWRRLRGLLGHPPLQPGEGLLIRPCTAIHMLGMKQALDVLFLDGDDKVVARYPELQPGGRSRRHRDAREALELPPGTIESSGTQVGDLLELRPG